MTQFDMPNRDTIEAELLVQLLADRLAELTAPEPWRSVEEPPEILEQVFARVALEAVRIGYHTRSYACGWATSDGRELLGVTGWQPIVRPEP